MLEVKALHFKVGCREKYNIQGKKKNRNRETYNIKFILFH